MKLYKGFDKNMKCRDFQYEEGETYTHPGTPKLCDEGFHACEVPLDCLKYYAPADGSIYREVEMEGVTDEHEDDSKRVGKVIKIGAKLSLRSLVLLSIHIIKQKTEGSPAATSKYKSTAATSGDYSSAATLGYYSTAATSGGYSTAATSGDYSTAATSGGYSTAATSGEYSTAATSGYKSTAAISGYKSTAATSGVYSTAATSGYKSTAATSGEYSTAATSGDYSTAATSGDKSTAATSGEYSTAATSGYKSTAVVEGKESIALAGGYKSMAKGALGCWLVLAERDDEYHILCVKAIKVDGAQIKPNTFYILKDGEVVAYE